MIHSRKLHAATRWYFADRASDDAVASRSGAGAEGVSDWPGGTVVEFEAEYGPGSSWIAEGLDRFLGSELPEMLGRDVARMKNLIETGSTDL